MLINGNCLEEMKNIKDNSVDLIFCDLPYGQTSCKWDCCIDLNLFWIEIMRIKILNAPIIMTTTTKFGVSLIQSAPKKCPFRYDLIWCKSAPCGFLSAKKMPMRKHEMIYVFYEKLPFYDLSSHKHKFIKEDNNVIDGPTYNTKNRKTPITREPPNKYDPPLPTSLVKENNNHIKDGQIYNGGKGMNVISDGKGAQYNPPLPTSLVKENEYVESKNMYNNHKVSVYKERKNGESSYDPPLPTSLLCVRNSDSTYGNSMTTTKKKEDHQQKYDPPLPNSLLEIKSTRGKHSTEKPVQLMEWVLKYYSKEGDTVLDPTMGSGSTGVACKNMNRKFIGIEMDKDIYDGAVKRLE